MQLAPCACTPPPLPALTLAEQVVAAELAYYRQLEQCVVTEADLTTWHRKQALCQTLQRPVEGQEYANFARHVLERHQYSLHAYIARQLSVEAWRHWFRYGGLVAAIW